MAEILIDDISQDDEIQISVQEYFKVVTVIRTLDKLHVYGFINSDSEFKKIIYTSGCVVKIKDPEPKKTFWMKVQNILKTNVSNVMEYFKNE